MSPMTKKQFATLTVLLTLFWSASPVSSVKAQARELPFAGIVSYSLSCTCSGTLWIWFSPLYLGGPVVTVGPVVYSPYSTILYGYYNIGVSGKWHLGAYTPGTQSCSMYIGTGCVTIPAIGVMTKVGTNY